MLDTSLAYDISVLISSLAKDDGGWTVSAFVCGKNSKGIQNDSATWLPYVPAVGSETFRINDYLLGDESVRLCFRDELVGFLRERLKSVGEFRVVDEKLSEPVKVFRLDERDMLNSGHVHTIF